MEKNGYSNFERAAHKEKTAKTIIISFLLSHEVPKKPQISTIDLLASALEASAVQSSFRFCICIMPI